ncbi:MAG TPA: DUF2058 family protein [Leucothrix mucor]|uniref:DUF2058 family protein n=1 Tax=Leucothrix mucor TaxID=45248 RepID=A0A7V2T1C2_LEUMU|nr:DUF2058 family protein [Leucothrix mucor]
MSSLRDQLFKAGLVSEEQVKKFEEKPKRPKVNKKINKPHHKKGKKNKPKHELTDLEKFYRQRSNEENKERQQAKKAKEEAAQRKKENNIKIGRLVNENLLDASDATERYNFIIGSKVKYAYVSAEQLEKLAEGKLALIFQKGKCRVISSEIAQKVREIDSNRLIIQQTLEKEG